MDDYISAPLSNPRWETYCQQRIAGKSQRQAMLAAFPSRASWKPETVDVKAAELEANGKVKARIEALKKAAAKRATITRAEVLQGLADSYRKLQGVMVLDGVGLSVDESGDVVRFNQSKASQAAVTGLSSIGKTLLDALPEETDEDEARPFVADFGMLLAEPFLKMHRRLATGAGLDAWIKGGRASTKSSAVSLEVVRLLMESPERCALVMVKRANAIRESVYQQIIWALSMLGVADEWECPASTLKMTNKRTGQIILFRGGDDTAKTKAIVAPVGMYFAVFWADEVDQFGGMAELRRVYQSVTRGAPQGKPFYRFHTFNPPRAKNSWANREAERRQAAGEFVMHVNFEDVPPEWLTDQFRQDAQALKDADEEAYRHEYLGEPVGYGAEVFPRAVVRPVTDDERRALKYVTFGVDWGFSQDPWVWLEVGYDAKNRTLYILDELTGKGLRNEETAELVLPKVNGAPKGADGKPLRDAVPYATVWCDGAEPKSIEDYRSLGIKAAAAPKQGAHSIKSGVRWLQDRKAIVIDPRCRVAAAEFPVYSYELTADQEPTGLLPDRDNHAIDACRYACCQLIADRAMV